MVFLAVQPLHDIDERDKRVNSNCETQNRVQRHMIPVLCFNGTIAGVKGQFVDLCEIMLNLKKTMSHKNVAIANGNGHGEHQKANVGGMGHYQRFVQMRQSAQVHLPHEFQHQNNRQQHQDHRWLQMMNKMMWFCLKHIHQVIVNQKAKIRPDKEEHTDRGVADRDQQVQKPGADHLLIIAILLVFQKTKIRIIFEERGNSIQSRAIDGSLRHCKQN